MFHRKIGAEKTISENQLSLCHRKTLERTHTPTMKRKRLSHANRSNTKTERQKIKKISALYARIRQTMKLYDEWPGCSIYSHGALGVCVEDAAKRKSFCLSMSMYGTHHPPFDTQRTHIKIFCHFSYFIYLLFYA